MPGFSLTNQYSNYNKTYISKNSNIITTNGTENSPYKNFDHTLFGNYKLKNIATLTSSSVSSDIKPDKNVLIIGSGTYYENLNDPSYCIGVELSTYTNLGNAYVGSIPDVQYFNLEVVGDGNVVITDKSPDSFNLSYRSFINLIIERTLVVPSTYVVNLTLRNIKFDYYYNPLELIMITNITNGTQAKTVQINLSCIDCEFSRVNVRQSYYLDGIKYFDENNPIFPTFFSANLNTITVLYRNCNFINCTFTNKLKLVDFPIYFNLREESVAGNPINTDRFIFGISNISLIKNCTFQGYQFVNYCRINSIMNTNFVDNISIDSTFTPIGGFTPTDYDIKMFSYNNYDVQTNDLFSSMGLSEANIPVISPSDIIKKESLLSNSYNPKYLNYRKQNCSVATTSIIKTTSNITVTYTGFQIILTSSNFAQLSSRLTIDGISLYPSMVTLGTTYNSSTGVKVLVKNGFTSSPSQTIINNTCNGLYYIYKFTDTSNVNPWATPPYTITLNRVDGNATYFDIQNTQTFIEQGVQNELTMWELSSKLSSNWLNENKIFKRLYNIPQSNASLYNSNESINAIRLLDPINNNLGINISFFYLNIITGLDIKYCAKLIPIFDSTGVIINFYILYPGEYTITSYIETLTLTQDDLVFNTTVPKIRCLNQNIFTLNNDYNFVFNFKKTNTYFYISDIKVEFKSSTFTPEPYAYYVNITDGNNLQLVQPKIAIITQHHLDCLEIENQTDTPSASNLKIYGFALTDGGQGFQDIAYNVTVYYWYGNINPAYNETHFLDASNGFITSTPAVGDLATDTSLTGFINIFISNNNNISIGKNSSLFRESYESNHIGGKDSTKIIPFISAGNKNTDYFKVNYNNSTINTEFSGSYVDTSDNSIINTQQVEDNIIIYGSNIIESNIIDLGEISKISKIELDSILNGLNIQITNGAEPVNKRIYEMKWGDNIATMTNYVTFEIATTPLVNIAGTTITGNASNSFNYNNRKNIYARYVQIKITLV
jgi:hypothetical protein